MKAKSKKANIDYLEQMMSEGQSAPGSKLNSHEEVSDQEVDQSLMEIYQDERGEAVDVSKFSIRRRRWWFKLIAIAIYSLVVLILGWFGYNYYTSYRAKNDLFTVNIETDKDIVAGQEFTYKINYKNTGSVAMSDVEVKIDWPEAFIFSKAEPMATQNNNYWQIGELAPQASGVIVVTGKLINKIGENNQAQIVANFRPNNLSSAFKVSQENNIILSDSSLLIGLSAPDTLSLGRNNEIAVSYQAKESNQIDNLLLTINQPDWGEVKLLGADNKIIEPTAAGVWLLNQPQSEVNGLKMIIIPDQDSSGDKNLLLKIETKIGDKLYLVDSRDFEFKVVNSRFNLLLKVNDNNSGGGVSAGQVLNYRIDYVNQGETNLSNLKIVASLNGAWLDWSSLKDQDKGQIDGQKIYWTKKELPGLALLKPGASGSINFSIKLKDWENGDKNDVGEISSFVYYTTEDDVDSELKEDQKSNTVNHQLNSNLGFQESIMYFNEDNIAVGSGPLPLVVGEMTNFKVYWHLSNTKHDLRDLTVVADLPDYVTWGGKNYTAEGEISYDQDKHQVIWKLDKMSAEVDDLVGEFSIGVTPRADQKERIIILMSGSTVKATDNATGSLLEVSSKAKTSQLEDDEIVETDGIVR
ncbi:MAG TPA: hypothetical protein PLT32_00810 [bacterium]|nr:hypothetical protein [bacterium]